MDESGIDLEPIPFDAQGRPRLELVFPDVDFADPEAVMALTSCAGFLETGALDLTSNPLLGVGVVELLNEFSQCVRSKGVPDFPDPIEGFSGIGGPYPLAEIPFADPDLEGAVDTCRSRISGLGS
jgi:hypothetical protein